jgi:hypothetical protein
MVLSLLLVWVCAAGLPLWLVPPVLLAVPDVVPPEAAAPPPPPCARAGIVHASVTIANKASRCEAMSLSRLLGNNADAAQRFLKAEMRIPIFKQAIAPWDAFMDEAHTLK